jgi:hypothetical protein
MMKSEMVCAEERSDGLGSIWNSGSGFRLNHAYTRMLHLDWKSELADSAPVPLSLKLTYGKAGNFVVEVQNQFAVWV